MKRYIDNTNVILDRNNKRRYGALFYPTLEYKDSDIYIISKTLDRLDLYAYKYYDDSRLWFIIAKANNLGKGTVQIPTGSRIRIPYPIDEYDYIQLVKELNV